MRADQADDSRLQLLAHWHAVAEDALKIHDWKEARAACKRILKLVPRHHFALETLVTAALQEGNTHEARALMEELLNVSPRDPLHRLRYATILQMQNESGAALQQFERIVQMYPEASFSQDARDAVEMLDKMQTSQILMMAAENSQFRWELERAPENTLERTGFVLSENGMDNLLHMLPSDTEEAEVKHPRLH